MPSSPIPFLSWFWRYNKNEDCSLEILKSPSTVQLYLSVTMFGIAADVTVLPCSALYKTTFAILHDIPKKAPLVLEIQGFHSWVNVIFFLNIIQRLRKLIANFLTSLWRQTYVKKTQKKSQNTTNTRKSWNYDCCSNLWWNLHGILWVVCFMFHFCVLLAQLPEQKMNWAHKIIVLWKHRMNCFAALVNFSGHNAMILKTSSVKFTKDKQCLQL